MNERSADPVKIGFQRFAVLHRVDGSESALIRSRQIDREESLGNQSPLMQEPDPIARKIPDINAVCPIRRVIDSHQRRHTHPIAQPHPRLATLVMSPVPIAFKLCDDLVEHFK
jgi:hypothetical protein